MRRYSLRMTSAAVVLCAIFGVLTFAPQGRCKASTTSPAANAADTDNAFAFRLFSEISKQDAGKNVFISPTSVSLALSMLYNGAGTTTKQAMANALHIGGLSLNDFNKSKSALMASLKSSDPKVKINIANSLWASQGLALKPDFLQRAKDSFAAEATNLDFSSPSAAAKINSWISKKTEGCIRNAINQISPDTAAILVNTIYFKGAWTSPFDVERTRNAPFTLQNGKSVSVPMMAREDNYKYYEGTDFQAISLPYGNGRFSMYVFLPSQKMGLKGFVSRLNAQNWNKWMRRFDSDTVQLALPKFRLEYRAEGQMRAALSALGMGEIFEPGSADFGGLCDTQTFISKVAHQAFVDVNEVGTEAAAATEEYCEAGETPSMIVNRPFFVAIRDNKTRQILFMGSVIDPRTGASIALKPAPKTKPAKPPVRQHTEQDDFDPSVEYSLSDSPFLVRELTQKDIARRFYAAMRLGEVGGNDVVPALVASLNDDEPVVVQFAAEALAKFKDPSCVAALTKLMDSEDIDVRAAAVRALAMNGGAASLDTIIAALNDPSRHVCAITAEVLVHMADPRAVQPLLGMLRDSNCNGQIEAAQVLGSMRAKEAVEPLIGWLSSPDTERACVAACALGSIDDPAAIGPLAEALVKNGGKPGRSELYTAIADSLLRSSDPRALDALKNALKTDQQALTDYILSAADQWPCEHSVELAIAALRDKGSFGGSMAVRIICRRIDAPIAEVLLKETAQGNKNVIGALWHVNYQIDPSAVDVLVKGLSSDNVATRRFAADALQSVKDSRVVEPLVKALTDSDIEVRLAASRGLAANSDPRAVEPLIAELKDFLRDPQEPLFGVPIGWLGQLKDKRAVPVLIEAVRFDAYSALQALGEIGDPSALPVIFSRVIGNDDDTRQAAIGALGKFKDSRSTNALMNLLKSKNELTSQFAACALAELGDPVAIDPLCKMAQSTDDTIKRGAISGLSRLRDSRAVAALIKALKDPSPHVCCQAAVALGEIGDPAAAQPLIDCLMTSKPKEARQIVGEALCKIKSDVVSNFAMDALNKRHMPLVAVMHWYYIRNGVEGSEPVLIDTLARHGDPWMHKALLMSGNKQLVTAAQEWIRESISNWQGSISTTDWNLIDYPREYSNDDHHYLDPKTWPKWGSAR